MAHLLHIGDYVNVAPSSKSSGGTGWIKHVDCSTGNATVEYVVQRKVSKEVQPVRIALATLDNVARRTSKDGNRPTRPSLLSLQHLASREYLNLQPTEAATLKPKQRRNVVLTEDLLKMPVLEVYAYLDRKRSDEEGWLRRAESPGCTRTKDGRKRQFSINLL